MGKSAGLHLAKLLILISGVSMVVGFSAAGFKWLLEAANHAFFGFFNGSEAVGITDQLLHRPYLMLLPAFGGLLTGLFLYYVAKGAKPSVPDVIGRIETKSGHIPVRHGAFNAIASSLTIGSGGSAGTEGTVIQIGSSFGSGIAGWFKLTRDDVRTMLGCGAAAGFGALFGAPIAGIFFVMEVLLREFNTRRLAFVAIATLVGYSVTEYSLDTSHVLVAEPFQEQVWAALPLFVGLGLVAAPFGVGFSLLTYQVARLSQKLSVRPWLKPAIGGLLVGIIGLFFPRIFGVGEEHIQQAITGGLPLFLLLLLPVAKLVATSLTIGTGGAGGIFVPSMFIGAMLGGAYGVICQQLFPGLVVDPQVFALVGMGVVLAAVIDAPLTALLLVVELSGQLTVLPAAVAAVAAATLLAGYMHPESMYSLQLMLKGIRRPPLSTPNPLAHAFVYEHMQKDLPKVRPGTRAQAALKRIEEYPAHFGSVAVSDKYGKLAGVVGRHEIAAAAHTGKKIYQIMRKPETVVLPGDTLHDVLRGRAHWQYPEVPVVNGADMLLGILPRETIIKRYSQLDHDS